VAGPPRTIKCHPGTHWGTREGKEKGEVAALSKVIGGGGLLVGRKFPWNITNIFFLM
jgi:hypothetical protein